MAAEEVSAAEVQKVVATQSETAPAVKANSGEVSSSTSFKTLDAFRKEAPEIYQKFMESIQKSIVDDFKRSSKRVIEAMKKMRKGEP